MLAIKLTKWIPEGIRWDCENNTYELPFSILRHYKVTLKSPAVSIITVQIPNPRCFVDLVQSERTDHGGVRDNFCDHLELPSSTQTAFGKVESPEGITMPFNKIDQVLFVSIYALQAQ
jgi:hypothetical protein